MQNTDDELTDGHGLFDDACWCWFIIYSYIWYLTGSEIFPKTFISFWPKKGFLKIFSTPSSAPDNRLKPKSKRRNNIKEVLISQIPAWKYAIKNTQYKEEEWNRYSKVGSENITVGSLDCSFLTCFNFKPYTYIEMHLSFFFLYVFIK